MARKRGWSGDLSKFGDFLRDHAVERDTMANAIGVTPSYISLLAHGRARPGLQAAIRIERWTAANVRDAHGVASAFPCGAWYPEDAAAVAA